MTAVKLAVEEMVEDLLKVKADVNAADSHGMCLVIVMVVWLIQIA